MDNTSILTAVLAVFTAIGNWISGSLTAMMPVFYQSGENGGLTFIGVMSVAGLGVAVILMILAMIRSYIRFR